MPRACWPVCSVCAIAWFLCVIPNAGALAEALTVDDLYGIQQERIRAIDSLQFTADRVWIRHRLPDSTPPMDVALMQFAPLPEAPRAQLRYRLKGIRVSAEEVTHGPFGVPSKRSRFTFTGSTFSVVSFEDGRRSPFIAPRPKMDPADDASTVTTCAPVPPTAEPYRFVFHADSGPWVYDRLRRSETWTELAQRSRLIGRSEVNGRQCVVVEIAETLVGEGLEPDDPATDAVQQPVAVTRVYFDPLLSYFPVKHERHGYEENGGSIEYRAQDVMRLTDEEGAVLLVPERAVCEYWLQEGHEYRLGHSVSWVVDPDSVAFNEDVTNAELRGPFRQPQNPAPAEIEEP
ncbi:MAG: hypothetical protein GY851_02565 [bacterium]|nr:hypothetical protein [bacterium]